MLGRVGVFVILNLLKIIKVLSSKRHEPVWPLSQSRLIMSIEVVLDEVLDGILEMITEMIHVRSCKRRRLPDMTRGRALHIRHVQAPRVLLLDLPERNQYLSANLLADGLTQLWYLEEYISDVASHVNQDSVL